MTKSLNKLRNSKRLTYFQSLPGCNTYSHGKRKYTLYQFSSSIQSVLKSQRISICSYIFFLSAKHSETWWGKISTPLLLPQSLRVISRQALLMKCTRLFKPSGRVIAAGKAALLPIWCSGALGCVSTSCQVERLQRLCSSTWKGL